MYVGTILKNKLPIASRVLRMSHFVNDVEPGHACISVFWWFRIVYAYRQAEAESSMPRGPRGERRPTDVIGNAVKVMRIVTGEETEELD
jgi:hypothetical protein